MNPTNLEEGCFGWLNIGLILMHLNLTLDNLRSGLHNEP